MYVRYLAVLLAATAAVVLSASSAAAAARTWVVDDNKVQCPNADFTSIQAAETAAAPGDTIKVCAGMYPEHVQVSKPLTFLGAQAGHDARTGRSDPSKESTLNNPDGGFSTVGSVSDVTVDGFTIQGAGTTSKSGIDFSYGGSGYRIVNDVIRNWWRGVGFNSNGVHQTLFRHDLIRGRDVKADDAPAGGIEANKVPTSNTQVNENLFVNEENSAIVFIEASSTVTITNNRSVGSDTFVAFFNGTSTDKIADNIGSGFVGSAFFFGGGNDGVVVNHNDLENGQGSGIRFSLAFGGTAAMHMVITNNTVKHMGVSGLNAGQGALLNSRIEKNPHFDNDVQDGIQIQSGNSGNLIRNNSMHGNRLFDAEDDSSGAGTAGTANTWAGNHCLTSSPPGLCT